MNRVAIPAHRPLTPRGMPLARPAAWLRARVPAAWVQIGMLFGVMAALPFARGVDNDYWWHVRTGDIIVHSGIPRTDPFSWTAGGKPWVLHEWLSEALMYVVQSVFGYGGNVVLFIGVSLAAIIVSYALARRLGAGSKTLVGLMILTTLTMTIFITPRPQVFTWLLFAAFLSVLARHDEGDDVPLWTLPVMMAFWVNLHLGFYFGLMLVGCWIAALLFEAVRGRDVKLRRPLLIAGACVLATFLNPSGPMILLYPLRYVFDSQATNAMVAEWQHPSLLIPRHWSIFITAALLLIALVVRGRPRPFLLLVTVAVVALSMQAVRNAPFAALVLLPVAGQAFARGAASEETPKAVVRIPAWIGAALVGVIMLLVGPLAIMQAGTHVSLGAPSEEGYPADSAEFVRDHYAGQRMFNDYNAGGYLAYKLYPDVPVAIDGRTDFYGNAWMEEYFTIDKAEPGWQDRLRDLDIDVILIAENRDLADALVDDPGWQLVFAGDKYVVYARR